MENVEENIELVANANPYIWNFSKFCEQFQEMIGCKTENCKLKFFFDVLQAFLEEVDRTDNDKKIFFISDFDTFRPLFFSVSTLRRQGIFP